MEEEQDEEERRTEGEKDGNGHIQYFDACRPNLPQLIYVMENTHIVLLYNTHKSGCILF